MLNCHEPRTPDWLFNTMLVLLILAILLFFGVNMWFSYLTHGGRL